MQFRDFGWALAQIRDGKKVARDGWNGKGMFLMFLRPESNMRRPFIYIVTADGSNVPWTASQSDVLGEDWDTVD